MAIARNGCFQLIHNGKSTSLKIYPPKGEGKPVSLDLITRYFDFIKIRQYNIKRIKQAIEMAKEPVEVVVLEREIEPHNELLFVDMDDDRMKAVCTFIPPSTKGKLMGKSEIKATLMMNGIRFGIRENVIDKYLSNRVYCTEIILAKGIPVVEGRNAEVKYMFSTKLSSKPKILEDGTVDFHNLDIINHVKRGDILAVIEPMVEGTPGKDLTGSTVLPRKVRKAVMKHGKNIYLSEDGLTMYSDVDGHVGLAGDRVFVSNVYEVPADVGVASGNIEYNGSVTVKGNVLSGYSVKADGDIIVDGVVEGATLIAGGQIYLKRGIQGMGKGTLIAAGNIVSRFMENCTAKSGQDVLADAIMHSNVIAVGTVTVKGRKGLITGGSVKSSEGIDAMTLGSSMGTKTEIIIGVDERILAEYKELAPLVERVKEESEKYIQIVALCKKKMEDGTATEENIQMAQAAQQKVKQIQEENQEKINRYRQLKAEIKAYQPGKVVVQNIAYQGVEIKISSEMLRLKKEADHSKFVLDGADIKILPLF